MHPYTGLVNHAATLRHYASKGLIIVHENGIVSVESGRFVTPGELDDLVIAYEWESVTRDQVCDQVCDQVRDQVRGCGTTGGGANCIRAPATLQCDWG